ncbi:MAG: hypothetical protein HY370_07485 [Proteobacteria bacterium]|nr:hypothetical protein [Pseudomonadota bacterium]
MSGLTGMNATIGDFREVTFFPYASADMGDIAWRREGGNSSVMSIGSLKIAMNFWDIMFSKNRIFAFDLEKIHIDEGIYFPRVADIEKMAMEETDRENHKGRFYVSGKYNGDDFNAEFSMDAGIQGDLTYFMRPKEGSDFTFFFPFFHAAGKVTFLRGWQFEFSKFRAGDQELSGFLLVSKDGDLFSLTGDLEAYGHADAESAAKALSDIYCNYVVPERPFFPNMTVAVRINGHPAVFRAECGK